MGNPIVQSLIGVIVTVPLSALVLMLTAKMFKLEDTTFKTAIKLTLIIGVIAFLIDSLAATVLAAAAGTVGLFQFLLVNIVLAAVLISKLYKLDIKKTLLVWLVWFLLSLLVAIVVGIIIGIIIALFIPMPKR